MKLTVERNKLLQKLEEANKMINSKALVKDYKYLYIKTLKEKNLIVFRGINPTNKSVLTAFLDNVEISDDFIIGVDGTILEKILNKMPNGNVNLELKELKTKSKLIVTNDQLKLEMETISPDNIPDFEVKDKMENSLILKREEFISRIKKVSFAVSTDEARPILCGINFSQTMDLDMKMVALDGYRLAMTSMRITKNETEGFDFTVSNDFLKDVIQVLNKVEDDMIKMEFNDKQLIIKTKYLKLQTTFLEGNFINFNQITKDAKEFESYTQIETKKFKESVDRIAIIANRSNNAVVMNIEENKLTMKGTSERAKSLETVKSNNKLPGDNDSVKIGINVKYIQDIIKKVDNDNIKMQFKTSMTPLYFIDERSEYMLLPVRING